MGFFVVYFVWVNDIVYFLVFYGFVGVINVDGIIIFCIWLMLF